MVYLLTLAHTRSKQVLVIISDMMHHALASLERAVVPQHMPCRLPLSALSQGCAAMSSLWIAGQAVRPKHDARIVRKHGAAHVKPVHGTAGDRKSKSVCLTHPM